MSRPQDLIWPGASLFKGPADPFPQAPAEKVQTLADQMKQIKDAAVGAAHTMKDVLIGHPEKILQPGNETIPGPGPSSLTVPNWVSGGVDAAIALPLFGSVARGGLELSGGIIREMKPFFSQLSRTLAERLPERASAEQILNIARKGSKAEELAYSGLEGYLKPGKKYLKTDVLRHLEQNAPELHERMMKNITADEVDAWHLQPSHTRISQIEPKFTDYTLPGGENHRELVVTLPAKEDLMKILTYKEYAKHFPVAPTQQEYERYAEVARNNNYGKGYSVPSGHAYGDPELDVNRLFHIRMNDRDKGKTLFMEELQSDWHQAGRREGYKGNLKPLTDEEKTKAASGFANNMDEIEWQHYFPGTKMPDSFDDMVKYVKNNLPEEDLRAFTYDDESGMVGKEGVPDAPFKTTWQELGMKRMIQEAAAGGYDRLAWTTGVQQADRYSLAKHFSKLEYNPNNHTLVGFNRTFEPTLVHQVAPDKLADYVGDDIAKKLINNAPTTRELCDEAMQKFKDAGISLNVSYDIPGRPHKFYMHEWGSEGAKKILPEDLSEDLKVYWDRLHENGVPNRLWNTKTNGVVEGDDLVVGGEGMRGFYDKMLPRYMEKFGKKYGVQVEKHEMPVGHEEKYFGIHSDFREPLELSDIDDYVSDYKDNQFEMAKEWVNEMNLEELKDYFTKNSTTYEREAIEAYNKTAFSARNLANTLRSWAISKAENTAHRISRKDAIKQLIEDGTIEARQAKDAVWSMKITPEMRKAVLSEGQPLFSKVPPIPHSASNQKAQPEMLPAHRSTLGPDRRR